MAGSGTRWPDQDEWAGKIYSAGWREPHGGTRQVIEPATGHVLADIGVASPADVARAGARAARAAGDWAAAAPSDRVEVLLRASAALREHSDTFRDWIVRESAGVPAKGDYEINAALAQLTHAVGLASLPRGEVLAPQVPGGASLAWRVPLGVVGVINPWNAPLLFAVRALAPALALGNTVLLKPDPLTPVSGGVLVARLFEDAGLPEGVLHVLPGGAETGQAVAADPHVAMVAFTGSTEAGRAVARVAGEGLKRVSLELGGKNPLVVLEDADVEAAALAGAMSTFGYQGQACVAAGRHLVHADLVEAYTDALVGHARTMRVGDPREEGVSVGPVISERQATRIERIVDASVAAGARVLTGGRRDGLFYPPTVLDHVDRTMPAFTEEIFGPVAPVIPFHTEAEAIEIANDTAYGLTAAVHSGSVPRATAVAERLRTGMAHINDVSAKDAANAPFGGMGISGNGSRIGGTASLEQFTQWRWMTAPGPV
ncbi:aldehyde dehydrogenase family protein [Streptomyces resistomycificus]|uniref:Benzaldehyde dehydrogenase n=1 Tax=Streptomyces resistomycificus TaxID=67356 RepID=A0A0L8LGQ0_9ACTN|nr:aldehyde dehydrogenase family protein [Streptomyces resistomycificus]KOG37241.1 benzaldehyde dehydrogenase [Streptomyces resistomycificus]KUN95200.1 benzaldehyde dehydrogenase [Streptomyces resistomycificus]